MRHKIGVLHDVGLNLAGGEIARGRAGKRGRRQRAGPGGCRPEQAGQQPTEQEAGPQKLGKEPPGEGVAHSRSDYSMEAYLFGAASAKEDGPFIGCDLSG